MPALKIILESSYNLPQSTHCIFWNFQNKPPSLEPFRTPLQTEDQAKMSHKGPQTDFFLVSFKSLALLFGLPGRTFRRYNSFWVLTLSTVSPHLCIPNYFCLSLPFSQVPKAFQDTFTELFPLFVSPRGLNVLPISNAVYLLNSADKIKQYSLNKSLFPLPFQLGCYL